MFLLRLIWVVVHALFATRADLVAETGCGAATQSQSNRPIATYTLVHEYDLPHPRPAQTR